MQLFFQMEQVNIPLHRRYFLVEVRKKQREPCKVHDLKQTFFLGS